MRGSLSLGGIVLSILLLCLCAVVVYAQTSSDTSGTSAPAGGLSCPEDLANDLKVLNFALTLENTDGTFFNLYINQFSPADFLAAGFDQSVYDRFQLIAAHELAHAATLAAAITARGGTPVPKCTYTYPVKSVQEFVALGRVFENVGTSAYDGGLNGLSDPSLIEITSTIATVEARHAAFLNQLVQLVAFPNVTDPARTAPEVARLIQPFIVSCPYAWNSTDVLPVVRPNGASYISQITPINTTSSSSTSSVLPRGTYTAAQYANDMKTLNYALTLEQLEARFYADGLSELSSSDFINGGFDQSVRDRFVLISQHETAHATTLEAVIRARGGNPVAPCIYNFDFSSANSFVQTAMILENTGVSAYDGAANTITDTGLAQLAATVATVEARHAAYLNSINSQSPFPNNTDLALTPDKVIAAAAMFITSCPNGRNPALDLPTVAPIAPTPCTPLKSSMSSSCSLELSEVAIVGLVVSPAFSPSTTEYEWSLVNGTNSASVSVRASNAASAGTITWSIAQRSESTQLTSGLPRTFTVTVGDTLKISVARSGVILALGDSITFGETNLFYNISDGRRGYPAILADAISAHNGAARPSIINLAIDGETASSFMTASGRTPPVTSRTDEVLARENSHYTDNPKMPQAQLFNQSVQQVKSGGQVVQAVTITLGFNELAAASLLPDALTSPTILGQALSDYRYNMRSVLQLIRDELPNVDLYILGYFNPFPADPAGDRNPAVPVFALFGGKLNAIIAELAVEFNGLFVDTFSPFVGREAELTYIDEQPAQSTIASQQYSGVAPIGNVHPNQAGYNVIGEQVVARMLTNGTKAADCVKVYTLSFAVDGAGNGNGNGSSAGSVVLASFVTMAMAAMLAILSGVQF